MSVRNPQQGNGVGGSPAMSTPPLRVLTVLPPRECFAPDEAGAIALLVHRMAGAGEVVAGSPPQPARMMMCLLRPCRLFCSRSAMRGVTVLAWCGWSAAAPRSGGGA